MPIIPARGAARIPARVAPADVVWAETVAGGGYASRVLARGTTLRLTDRAGDGCAHLLLFNADQPWERLNVADTVKIPWQAYLAAGHPLLSDQGRVLATITADSSTRHDALCGASSRAANEARYGDGSPHGPAPAGRELFKLAAAKHGLSPRDVPPSLSFFQGVRAEADGSLLFLGSAGPRREIEIRAELPLIVLLANVAHPLDPRPAYICTPLEILAWRGAPTSPEDPLWSASPELERAFLNTADYAGARGI
jgi:urea carboxylase-associated protein 2